MKNQTENQTVKLAFDLEGKPATLPTGYRPPEVFAKDFEGIWQIQGANENAGLHFFKPETMRFFGSRIRRYLGAGVFITSEVNPNQLRAFSIRIADINGQVWTFGEFHSFKHGRTAAAAARRLVKLLKDGKTVADSKGQTFSLAR